MSSSYVITLILEAHNLSSCEIKAWKKIGLSNSQSLICEKRNFSNIALDFVAPTCTESAS